MQLLLDRVGRALCLGSHAGSGKIVDDCMMMDGR